MRALAPENHTVQLTLRTAAVALAALALAAGAFLLVSLREGPTDEERIRTLLDEAARAVQERRVGDAMDAVSDRFRGEGLDKAGVKSFVTYQALRGEWVRVAVASSEVAVDGDGAEATVHVVLARSGAGERLADLLPQAASAYRIACTLAREDGAWRITAAAWRPVDLATALAGTGDGSAASR